MLILRGDQPNVVTLTEDTQSVFAVNLLPAWISTRRSHCWEHLGVMAEDEDVVNRLAKGARLVIISISQSCFGRSLRKDCVAQ